MSLLTRNKQCCEVQVRVPAHRAEGATPLVPTVWDQLAYHRAPWPGRLPGGGRSRALCARPRGRGKETCALTLVHSRPVQGRGDPQAAVCLPSITRMYIHSAYCTVVYVNWSRRRHPMATLSHPHIGRPHARPAHSAPKQSRAVRTQFRGCCRAHLGSAPPSSETTAAPARRPRARAVSGSGSDRRREMGGDRTRGPPGHRVAAANGRGTGAAAIPAGHAHPPVGRGATRPRGRLRRRCAAAGGKGRPMPAIVDGAARCQLPRYAPFHPPLGIGARPACHRSHIGGDRLATVARVGGKGQGVRAGGGGSGGAAKCRGGWPPWQAAQPSSVCAHPLHAHSPFRPSRPPAPRPVGAVRAAAAGS